MSSINLNSTSLLLTQRILRVNTRQQADSLSRLATGLRINRGQDDPAGLITSENLRAILKALEAETRSIQRAEDVINVAEGALSEVSDLLGEAQALTVKNANTAGLSAAEKEANQMELDSILSTINRLSSSTTFNEDKLLDGTASITVDGQQVNIDSVSTGSLGTTTVGSETYTLSDLKRGGKLNIESGDLSIAQDVLASARISVASQRGNLGAFARNAIGSRLKIIAVMAENISAANSKIRDTDYASETANFARLKVLLESSLKSVKLAGAQPLTALNLLA